MTDKDKERRPVEDDALRELALKIEAELPEELIRFISFSQDVKAENLVVDWAVKLEGADLKLLTDIVVGYGGSYVNRKEGEQDRGCFWVPKTQPPPAIQTEQPAPEKKTVSAAAVDQPIKQPSPLMIHQRKYCESCSDQATCNPRTAAGRERFNVCFRVMELQYFDFIAERLHKIAGLLEAAPKVQAPLAAPLQQSSSVAKPSTPTSSAPVQRNTRPTEGHMENGITWIKAFRASDNAEYEKALDKDNTRSEAYERLRERINAKVDAGKKGLEEGGKWHFIDYNGDICRKPAKQFARR